jgi:hypothetical protein
MRTPAHEPESDISGPFLLRDAEPALPVPRLLNVLVESHNVESPSRLLRIGVYEGFCVERTTGLEPATLTLAR